jgi:hypothetical protein
MPSQLPLPNWDTLTAPPLALGDEVVLVAHNLPGEVVGWCLDQPVIAWSVNGGGAFVEGKTLATPMWHFTRGYVERRG